jgi:prevent-host-death family protein
MEVTTAEAKKHLSALLKRVEGGERIRITRYGKPVAVLNPPAKTLPSMAEFRATLGRTRSSPLRALLDLRDDDEERGQPSTSTPAS